MFNFMDVKSGLETLNNTAAFMRSQLNQRWDYKKKKKKSPLNKTERLLKL